MRLSKWAGGAALAMALGGLCAEPSRSAPSAARQATEGAVVQPTGPQVPANLLRLSIRFARPVDGPVLPRIALVRADGTTIREPFLDQELWSPDGKVLTILLHPGRVKSGLIARKAMGSILSTGEVVSLALDGAPIKRWSVGPADEAGPMASAWKVFAVKAHSRQPLVVRLDGPIDGQDAGFLAVADSSGRRVAGRARLIDGESTWTFTPKARWSAGEYRLMVRGTLEDPAGNRLGSRFETSIASPPSPATDVTIPFAASTPVV